MKYTLGIQTAEFPNAVALIKADGSFVETVWIREKEQTVELLSKSVNQLISKLGLRIKDIGLVAVCLGPGSYTGTRGGLAFAKGLCQFPNIPLIGVSAFEVLREAIRNKKEIGDVCYLLDAKNERVFYTDAKRDLKQIKTDSIFEVISRVGTSTLFMGSGAVANKDIIWGELRDKAEFVPEKQNKLSAEQVAKVGLSKYRKNPSIYSKDYLYKVKPLYILPPTITKAKN
jgi:tRNA threonylcarbamoyladenosine biosynthesis protein TsaB